MTPVSNINPFVDVFQFGYVTHDLDRALSRFDQEHGMAEFSRVTFRQQPDGPELAQVALGWAGGRQIEVIQPVGDAAPIYSDTLKGQSSLIVFHHFGIRIPGTLDAWESRRSVLEQPGRPVVFEGAIGDDCRYAYVDERATLGHYLEYIWFSDRFAAASGMERASS